MFDYAVVLERDTNGTLRGEIPDLPELNAVGDTEAAALRSAASALHLIIAARMRDRRDIPDPSPSAGRPTVSLPLQDALKVLVYRAMREDKVNKSELARRIDKAETQVRRLLDLDRATPISQIEEALAALGRHITVLIDRQAA